MKRNPLVICAVLFIQFYRHFISFLLPSSCRFYPSCSEYALEAFNKYGFIKGMWFALRRISRCHPLSAGGYDPVR